MVEPTGSPTEAELAGEPAALSATGVDVIAPAADGSTDPRRHRNWRRPAAALASYLVLVFALITLNFFLPRAMPGDPIDAMVARGPAGFTLGEAGRAKFAEYYGLDGSLASQYGNYLSRLARGDLGRSITTNIPVSKEIKRKLPWTVLLVGTSTVLSFGIGVVAGVHSGWRRDKPVDRTLLTGLLSAREFPPYLLASLLLFVFAVKLHWFPLTGAHDLFYDALPFWEKVLDVAHHLLLPTLVLTVGLVAGNYLVMRAGMVAELGSDYLLLGRAKGLRPRTLKYNYAARNALLPVVSLIAVELGFAVTADVLVERVFSYPGLGTLLFEGILQRDYPMIQGIFLILSLSIVTLSALADMLYRRLDPRTTA